MWTTVHGHLLFIRRHYFKILFGKKHIFKKITHGPKSPHYSWWLAHCASSVNNSHSTLLWAQHYVCENLSQQVSLGYWDLEDQKWTDFSTIWNRSMKRTNLTQVESSMWTRQACPQSSSKKNRHWKPCYCWLRRWQVSGYCGCVEEIWCQSCHYGKKWY